MINSVEDIQEKLIDEIRNMIIGSSVIPWDTIEEVLDIEDAEGNLDEDELLEACDVRFCNECGLYFDKDEVMEYGLGFICKECKAIQSVDGMDEFEE